MKLLKKFLKNKIRYSSNINESKYKKHLLIKFVAIGSVGFMIFRMFIFPKLEDLTNTDLSIKESDTDLEKIRKYTKKKKKNIKKKPDCTPLFKCKVLKFYLKFNFRFIRRSYKM